MKKISAIITVAVIVAVFAVTGCEQKKASEQAPASAPTSTAPTGTAPAGH